MVVRVIWEHAPFLMSCVINVLLMGLSAEGKRLQIFRVSLVGTITQTCQISGG